jgi:predicted anti-sigma-YlaC factor YlaD
MSDCGHAHEDGAYVLGALSPEDRVAFERHLPGCPACAQSVRELAGLPGLLARVPVGVLEGERETPPVPDTLLPKLFRRARQVRRRRRWVTSGLVAAAVAVGAVGALLVTAIGDDDAPPTAGPKAVATTAAAKPFVPVGAVPISGWVSLTPVAWGTRLDLICTYTAATRPYGTPVRYTMHVTHADGTTEQVAAWTALPGKTIKLSAATASGIDDIKDVEVRTSSGRTVLELS